MALFSCCRPTVRRGFPSFLGATTIREHHVVAVPCGTGSMIPSLTSRSMSSLTWHFQWWGTGMGVCTTTGEIPSLNLMLTGTPCIDWSGWWWHVLNALDEKADRIHSFSRGMLSMVAGNGIVVGVFGVCVRSEHLQGFCFSLTGRACCLLSSEMCWEVEAVHLELISPGCGNSCLMTPNSLRAVSERKNPLTFLDTICRVIFCLLRFERARHQ